MKSELSVTWTPWVVATGVCQRIPLQRNKRNYILCKIYQWGSHVSIHTVQWCLLWEGWLYLGNRKHVQCFYRVIETQVRVWENEKCCGNMSRRRVLPQFFWVLPNSHECLYNSIETWRTDFLFLLIPQRKKENKLVYSDHQNVNSLCSHHLYVNSLR